MFVIARVVYFQMKAVWSFGLASFFIPCFLAAAIDSTICVVYRKPIIHDKYFFRY